MLPDTVTALAQVRRLREHGRYRPPAVSDAPVVLYGAGQLGQMALAWCRQQGLRVAAVVDASAPKWRAHPAWQGVRVLEPEAVPADWRSTRPLWVCISTLPFAPLRAALQRQGWAAPIPFYDAVDAWPVRQSLNNGWHAPLPAAGSAGDQALAEVLAGWGDDRSRAHHLQFLAWRCARLEWTFEAAPVEPDARYFIPEFAACWRPGERIVDAGAHHGQVLERWMKERAGWLAQAWAVEPDPANASVLEAWRDTLSPQEQARVSCHRLALSRRAGQRRFIDGQGYASRIWSAGGQRIDTVALDALGWSPTFVKLHLEGAEWRALQGAAGTLRSSRPLLALTVYHRRDGLWPTAHWLMRELPGYRWLFRLHGWQGTAAVVYGLPQERLPD